MKFRLLLYVLHKKMAWAARKNPRFKKFIQDKQMKFAIKAGPNGAGRYFVFDSGQISSSSKKIDACDAAMVWSDAETAFKVMASGNDEASVAALTEKKLKVEGDLKAFMWFSRAVDIMMGKA